MRAPAIGRIAAAAALAVLTGSAVACGPKVPDYQTILTPSSQTSTPTTTEKPVPLSKYLESIGVGGHQVATDSLPGLTVSIPTPPGWERFTNPNIPPETVLLSKGRKYPTARLVVFTLTGTFDPVEVARHGNADAYLFDNFKKLDESSADFNGFPSSMLQGSYNLEGQRLHTWNRIVIPTSPGPGQEKFLVQLTITSLAEQAGPEAKDIETIIRGFVVARK
ncbi:hypothetical protein BST27_17705 [Mycobacterium intermedium]|uniref:Lipoprotein LpqT n=1 Tax=Mycobacterium intermedium TaxID=28445 RepID=A0A1E3SH20_MYCIE|nr:LpqN/LpqT family lipoprotein [Mycobacterium intermedium]MCV6963241.1 LpqN/LpqT family lipoprotein [Mycobacterium intermedium]ODR01464.1 hypothetical protein BHQ20_08185 [Mycobacterium intermedium]OPE46431.1 hypothetical protein BV508_25930 [Mycobacterium intermedium]ORB01236.1 hypothetical protein BST27_17705 [Mycobacterium intermedium]